MQYKKSSTDADWLPKVNPIRMWKEDANKNPKLPLDEPFPVQPNPIWSCTIPAMTPTSDNFEKDTIKVEATKKRKSHILKSLQKYINFWKTGMSWNETYTRVTYSYVQYWEDIYLGRTSSTNSLSPSFSS